MVAARAYLLLAFCAGAAIVLSAPFAQQVFEDVGPGANTVALAAAVALALWRIRDHRLQRYLLIAVSFGIAAASIRIGNLYAGESFHFIEYGLVGLLFYLAWHGVDDVSVVILPLLGALVVASADEWFQWFIPIRVGEARDIGLDCIATVPGILFAAALKPPRPLTFAIRGPALRRLVRWAAGAAGAFVVFLVVVQVGHDVTDPEIGSFRSRYTAADLERAARDRAQRWRTDPPIVQPRLSREDQYLTEGLWRIARRNDAWDEKDFSTAWHENQILEKFYAPVLDAPTYASTSPDRWSVPQREDARARASNPSGRYVSTEYAYPLYVWPRILDPQ